MVGPFKSASSTPVGRPARGERASQVGGDVALPDPTLSAHDRHDLPHGGQPLCHLAPLGRDLQRQSRTVAIVLGSW